MTLNNIIDEMAAEGLLCCAPQCSRDDLHELVWRAIRVASLDTLEISVPDGAFTIHRVAIAKLHVESKHNR